MRYQSLVEEHLRHADITSCLCTDLLGSLNSCLELAEQIKQEGLQVLDIGATVVQEVVVVQQSEGC